MSTLKNFGSLLPKIVIEPPGPKSKEMAELLAKYETPSLSAVRQGDIPIDWARARGSNILDSDGNIYIDFTAAYTAAICGYSHPNIVKATHEALEKVMFAPPVYSNNEARAKLAKKIAEINKPNLSVSHFLNGGAEAIEAAIKTARLYKKKHAFIAFHGGFHGKLHGALSLTSNKYYREALYPAMPITYHVPYAYCYRCAFGREYPGCDMQCLRYLEYVLTAPATAAVDVAGLILEPVQGHGGWIVPPKEFLPGVEKICKEHDILLIFDEIITGFGRTGKMFSYEHYDNSPDILVCAKGITSGFPLSACVSSEEIMNAWTTFKHTSTYSAYPLGCAIALASIETIQKEDLVEKSARMGKYALKRLKEMEEEYSIVGEARGLGMMFGLEIVEDKKSKKPGVKETERIVTGALKKGLILQPPGGQYHNILKMSPPLVITEEQLKCGLDILDEAIKEVNKKVR